MNRWRVGLNAGSIDDLWTTHDWTIPYTRQPILAIPKTNHPRAIVRTSARMHFHETHERATNSPIAHLHHDPLNHKNDNHIRHFPHLDDRYQRNIRGSGALAPAVDRLRNEIDYDAD